MRKVIRSSCRAFDLQKSCFDYFCINSLGIVGVLRSADIPISVVIWVLSNAKMAWSMSLLTIDLVSRSWSLIFSIFLLLCMSESTVAEELFFPNTDQKMLFRLLLKELDVQLMGSFILFEK